MNRSDAPGDTLPADTTVGRVALRVNDLDRVARFYESVIGLEARSVEGERAVLDAGGQPLLVLVEDREARPRGREETGLFHTAFLVPSRAALGDALHRIEDGWHLDGASNHVVSEALYCTDPEGNGVEVYRDRQREEWPVAADGTVGIDTLPLDFDGVRDAAAATEETTAGSGDDIPSAATGSGDDTASTVPSGTTIGHVHLEVSSLEAATAFYVDTLGMEITQRYGESALFVAAGGYHHHLGLNVWGGRSAPPRGRGLDWFELVVPDAASLTAIRERFERDGETTEAIESEIDLVDEVEGDSFAVSDRDGIRIRVRTGDGD